MDSEKEVSVPERLQSKVTRIVKANDTVRYGDILEIIFVIDFFDCVKKIFL
jgi:hypothetical protein